MGVKTYFGKKCHLLPSRTHFVWKIFLYLQYLAKYSKVNKSWIVGTPSKHLDISVLLPITNKLQQKPLGILQMEIFCHLLDIFQHLIPLILVRSKLLTTYSYLRNSANLNTAIDPEKNFTSNMFLWINFRSFISKDIIFLRKNKTWFDNFEINKSLPGHKLSCNAPGDFYNCAIWSFLTRVQRLLDKIMNCLENI